MKWLNGYQVIIAQVLRCHGDGRLDHPMQQALNPETATPWMGPVFAPLARPACPALKPAHNPS